MANVRRPDMEQDQKVLRWMMILPVMLIASLIISLVLFNAFYGRPGYPVGQYDATKPVASLSYRAEPWVPQGPPVQRPDDEMTALGYSDEGYLIYTPRNVFGGGGGQPETTNNPEHYRQVYLRRTDGLYQPIVRK